MCAAPCIIHQRCHNDDPVRWGFQKQGFSIMFHRLTTNDVLGESNHKISGVSLRFCGQLMTWGDFQVTCDDWRFPHDVITLECGLTTKKTVLQMGITHHS